MSTRSLAGSGKLTWTWRTSAGAGVVMRNLGGGWEEIQLSRLGRVAARRRPLVHGHVGVAVIRARVGIPAIVQVVVLRRIPVVDGVALLVGVPGVAGPRGIADPVHSVVGVVHLVEQGGVRAG